MNRFFGFIDIIVKGVFVRDLQSNLTKNFLSVISSKAGCLSEHYHHIKKILHKKNLYITLTYIYRNSREECIKHEIHSKGSSPDHLYNYLRGKRQVKDYTRLYNRITLFMNYD